MKNIILMAGSGKRFSDKGYKKSKPLINVSGEPMIIQACKSMPNSDEWTFVIREEHQKNEELISKLKSIGNKVNLIVDNNPIGQLNSCLVAEEFIPKEGPFFVGACDMGMVYDKNKIKKIFEKDKKNQPDMIVFSFSKQPNLLRNPNAWGWLKIEEKDSEDIITSVSVKKPISNNPFNDYAITGSFIFKNKESFLKIANNLIKTGKTVKGEYYIDSMIEIANKINLKIISFPVDKYIGWGTPMDYEEYCFWENAFKKKLGKYENYLKSKPEFNFWREYFESKK